MFNRLRLWMLEKQVNAMVADVPVKDTAKKAPVKKTTVKKVAKKAPAKKTAAKKESKKK